MTEPYDLDDLFSDGDIPALRLRRHPDAGIVRMADTLIATMLRPAEKRTANYPDDIEDFIEQVLGITLFDIQRTVIEAVMKHRRVAIKSCHASGKTWILAAIVVAFLHIHEYSKVITTGPGGTQVSMGMWQYIRSMYDRRLMPLLGKPSKTEWEVAANWFAMGYSPAKENTSAIQGYHAPDVLLVIDEDADPLVLAALGSLMTSGRAHIVIMGNPTKVGTILHKAFTTQASTWHRMTITYLDTPNIKAGRVVQEGFLEQVYVDTLVADHGWDSDEVRTRLLAEWPLNAGNAYVPDEWIGWADKDKRGPDWGAPIDLGIDLARYGDDSSVLVARMGAYAFPPIAWRKFDTMGSVQQIRAATDDLRAVVKHLYHQAHPGAGTPPGWTVDGFPPVNMANVDEGGLGAGVLDRLEELRRDGKFPARSVNGINFGGTPQDGYRFVNVVDEMWSNLRDAFEHKRIRGAIDPLLIEDLSNRRTVPTSSHTGKHLENKEKFKKRVSRSPDWGDAYAMAYYVPQGGTSTHMESVTGDQRFGAEHVPMHAISSGLSAHGSGAYDDADDDAGGTAWPS